MADELEVEVEEKKEDIEAKGNGKGEKDDKKGPPEGSERWNTIYWKAKEGERAAAERDALREELKHSRDMMKEMGEHNKKLAEVLENLGEGSKRSEENAEVNKVESKIAELRAQRKTAREKADYEAEDRIEEEIADLRFKVREMKSKPVNQDGKEKGKEASSKKSSDDGVVLTDEDKTIYKEWLTENSWIYENPRARSLAVKAENEIRKDPEFDMATEKEILEEVRLRVEDKIKPPSGDVDPFHSGGRSGGGAGVQKVKLSATEVDLAQGFGIDPKKVAEQKLLIAKARGGRSK
jgi:hypothetical protein